MLPRTLPRAVAALAVAVAALLAPPALAQGKDRVDIGLGLAFPLLSNEIHLDQNLEYGARVQFRVNDWLRLGGVYRTLPTETDLPRPEGAPEVVTDVDVDLLGATATFYFSGEQEMRLIGVASAGQGEVSSNDEAVTPSVDVDFWYEVGVGARWQPGNRFSFQLTLGFRSLKTDADTNAVGSERINFVPAFEVFYTF